MSRREAQRLDMALGLALRKKKPQDRQRRAPKKLRRRPLQLQPVSREDFDAHVAVVRCGLRSYEEGQCYANAVLFVAVASNPDLWRIVNGFPLKRGEPHAGKRFGHAWVETVDGQVVIEPHSGGAWRAEWYYEHGAIEKRHVERYTLEQARKRVMATGLWGSWEPDPYAEVVYGEGIYYSGGAK